MLRRGDLCVSSLRSARDVSKSANRVLDGSRCWAGLGCADATDELPAFRITTKRQENGYFEMTLPKAFFEGNPHTIQVNWIDFYR